MIAKSKSPSPSSRRVEWSVTSDHKRLRKRYELQCRTKAMSEMWRANSRRGTAGTLFLVPPPADLCSHRGRELLEPVDKPPGPSHFGEAVQAKCRVVEALPRLGRAGARPTGKRGGRASRGKASSVGSCVRERRCHCVDRGAAAHHGHPRAPGVAAATPRPKPARRPRWPRPAQNMALSLTL